MKLISIFAAIVCAFLVPLSVAQAPDPDSKEVTLAWDHEQEPDFLEYRVKLGSQSGVYTLVLPVRGGAKQLTTAVAKVGYHYAVVTAVNTSNIESDPSAELVFSATGQKPNKPGKPFKL